MLPTRDLMIPGSARAWSWEEDKIFENALVEFPEGVENRWQRIADKLPQRSAADVESHYNILLADIAAIESGSIELPRYTNTSNRRRYTPRNRGQSSPNRTRYNPRNMGESSSYGTGYFQINRGEFPLNGTGYTPSNMGASSSNRTGYIQLNRGQSLSIRIGDIPLNRGESSSNRTGYIQLNRGGMSEEEYRRRQQQQQQQAWIYEQQRQRQAWIREQQRHRPWTHEQQLQAWAYERQLQAWTYTQIAIERAASVTIAVPPGSTPATRSTSTHVIMPNQDPSTQCTIPNEGGPPIPTDDESSSSSN